MSTIHNNLDIWQNGLHPEDKHSALAALQAALNGEQEFDTVFRVRHRDGTVKYIKANGLVIRGADGRAARMIGINADISERKLADIAKSRNSLQQRAILDNLPMMAWLKDKESRLEMVNEPYARACNHTVDECVGKSDMELFPHEMAEKFIEDDRQVCVSGMKKQREELISSPEGDRWHLTYKTPIFDERGEIIGTAGVSQDITQHKEAERQRLLLEAQLHQAQKMESIGRLAGGVAHDFNNKLSVILGYTELAAAESDPEVRQGNLEQIQIAAEQSADLTRQLLAFARKQTIVPKVLNLNETVSGMLKMLRRLMGENIELSWQSTADLWLLNFDPSQIDQILANLCVNARDSITDGGKITIETGNSTIDEDYCARNMEAVPGDYVRITVSDNGCGMGRETLTRIFDPFFTTKEAGKGTGLGLATVFGIVKQNRGFIDVDSEPGRGTTFTIHLPRHADIAARAPKKEPPMLAPRGLETILVVEDELSILNVVSRILTKQGYGVLQANTVADAILLAKENAEEIKLLITDVIMPEMSGKELAERLQSLNSKLKCLFVSGYTSDVIAQHGVLDEGVSFLQKPFSARDLAKKVREVLDDG